MVSSSVRISVVTPTFRRPEEVKGLLENLAGQELLPSEVFLVDGAPADEDATDQVIAEIGRSFPFEISYIRHGGGTAIQRNVGIDAALGDFVAFIDDDVRLSPGFFKNIIDVFSNDPEKKVGGVVGYRMNQHFELEGSGRWRWYKRLNLLTVYEPGRYDFKCGYPINNNMQPPFRGTREVDFMTTACAVWRREVFDAGLRFDHFFRDYGVLEDAHLSLRAGKSWKLLQCGDAHCDELHSQNGRVDRRRIGLKSVVNYYFVFRDVVAPLSAKHKIRFWRYQAFEFLRIASSLVRRRDRNDLLDLAGRVQGIVQILFNGVRPPKSS